MHKHVVFDFFGVIVNEQYQDWLASHGLPNEAQYATAIKELDLGKLGLDDFFDWLSGETGILTKTIRQEFEDTTELNQEVVDLIRELRQQNVPVSLLSNSNGDWLRMLLEKYQIGDQFDHQLISADVGMIKPHPEFFHLLFERLGVQPDVMLFIDDRQTNVDAARGLGMHAALFTGARSLRHLLLPPA